MEDTTRVHKGHGMYDDLGKPICFSRDELTKANFANTFSQFLFRNCSLQL